MARDGGPIAMTNGFRRRNCQWRVLSSVVGSLASDRRAPRFDGVVSRAGPSGCTRVASFDFLALVLHDAATESMRMHILETVEAVPAGTTVILPTDEDPAGVVWQTQQPLIISCSDELARWPRLFERAEPYGYRASAFCRSPRPRRRLGALVFTAKHRSAYDAVNIDFLQHVANQVAVAVENALAFQESRSSGQAR